MNTARRAITGLLLLTSAGASFRQPAAAQTTDTAATPKTYVAVGDSLAYGFKSINPTPNFTPPGGSGFPGYTAAYASFLSAQSGTGYNVDDLGVVGETSSSLFASSVDGVSNAGLNSNYATGTTAPTQAALLHTLLTTPGSNVGVITIQVGANDVLQAVETGNPAAVPAALATVQANYTTLLSQVKTDEGGRMLSNVTIIGYYDPYADLSPTNYYYPELSNSAALTAALNGVLSQEAAMFGARYVDLATPFYAHLPTYDSYVLANSAADALPDPTGGNHPLPNDHPTDLGYALIAQALAAPEPSAPASLCLGALATAGLAFRARRRKA